MNSGIPDPDPASIAIAEGALADGSGLDDAGRQVVEVEPNPLLAVKALRAAQPGLSIRDAMRAIYPHLPTEVKRHLYTTVDVTNYEGPVLNIDDFEDPDHVLQS